MKIEDKFYWREIFYISMAMICYGTLVIIIGFPFALTWFFLYFLLIELVKTNGMLIQIREKIK